MEKYVRLCKTVNTTGLLVPMEEVTNKSKFSKRLAAYPNSDWYTSVYYFGDKAKEYFISNGNSVKGYNGDAYAENLVFDFDSTDLEQAKKDVVELLKRMKDNGVDVRKSCNIYFSGNKGFHVEFPIARKFTPEKLKLICSNLAKGLKSFDLKIYNVTRLFRIANTKHQVSGLYKIPLDPIEFFKMPTTEMKERAKNPIEITNKANTINSPLIILSVPKVRLDAYLPSSKAL
jgi:hypothetical protein